MSAKIGQERLQRPESSLLAAEPRVRRSLHYLRGPEWGRIRIIDRDYVEPSNLQRQTLFDEADARESLPKAIAAARKISAFNSDVVVDAQVADLTPSNVESLLEGSALVLDGTDNFETRYLVNDYAVKHGVPWIYAAAVGSYGVTLNVLPGVRRA